MPNSLQLGYLLSTVLTFALLLLLSSLFASYLNIRSPFFIQSSSLMDAILSSVRSFSDSPALATAGLLILSACIFVVINLKSLRSFRIHFLHKYSHGYSLVRRAPVLDVKLWKEFPLHSKIIVSTITALYVPLRQRFIRTLNWLGIALHSRGKMMC